MTNLSISEAESKSTVYLFYKAKHFQAFHYYYKLARDCRRRIEKIIKSNDVEDVTEDFFIKIGIMGKFTDVDLTLISEGKGNIYSKVKCELKVYFDFYCISFFEIWHQYYFTAKRELPENRHIWAVSPLLSFQNEKSYPKIVQTKEQFLRIITTCLNKPLTEMLEGWLANLETEGSSKQAAGSRSYL